MGFADSLAFWPTASEGKPVERFEVGHWYKWVGDNTRPKLWERGGSMDAILDHQPRLCVKTGGSPDYARFEGIQCNLPDDIQDGCWSWVHLENFREVPPPAGMYAPRIHGHMQGHWHRIPDAISGAPPIGRVVEMRVGGLAIVSMGSPIPTPATRRAIRARLLSR